MLQNNDILCCNNLNTPSKSNKKNMGYRKIMLQYNKPNNIINLKSKNLMTPKEKLD